MKNKDDLQNVETNPYEPDFTQGDADAKPPIALQEKEKPFFYTVDDLRNLPDPGWLIQDILAEDGIGAFVGASKAGKSFLAIELAFCVARGEPFFGYETKKSPVLYLCFEGQGRFKYRLFAWEKHHNEKAPENFFIKYDCDFLKLKKEIMTKFPQNCLTIIDTLSAAAPKIDENGSGMKEIIEKAKDIASVTHGAVLIIHHMGKNEKLGSRGHSSFPAGIDTEFLIKRKDNSKNDSRSWEVNKNRDGEEGLSGSFTLQKIQVGVDKIGNSITSCVIKPCEDLNKKLPQSLQEALTVLKDALSEEKSNEISFQKWQEKWEKKRKENPLYIDQKKESVRGSFNYCRKELIDRGYITENQSIIRILRYS